ncbi:hypothetical protein F5Y18DRAFT_352490 [Xylariaceae sp. FL1019]|nr:hypothetical protein F5Y18DRAFT_352490 [Xylariaceae sp. FL1019]
MRLRLHNFRMHIAFMLCKIVGSHPLPVNTYVVPFITYLKAHVQCEDWQYVTTDPSLCLASNSLVMKTQNEERCYLVCHAA